MRAVIWFVVLMCGVGLVNIARAEGPVIGSCSLTWDASTGHVDGYRVYVGTSPTNKAQAAETVSTSIPCSALNLTEGQNYAHVTAYNVAGESGASDTVPFVLVTTPPGVPVNLRLSD